MTLPLLAALALSACGGDEALACERFRLDREEWRDARKRKLREDAPTSAQRIADAIARCGTLHGRPREEVMRLLGPPETTDVASPWPVGADFFEYRIGIDRRDFSIDYEVLFVRFDRDGRVTEADVRVD